MTSSFYGSCIPVLCVGVCATVSIESVLSEIGTEFLNFILMNFTFKMLKTQERKVAFL
jgi:hypothetical protein